MSYDVQTPVFEGPFDLLLHLILREQVDLYELKLTVIVDAYITTLEAMEHIDLLVVLPLDGEIDAPEDENPELREAMNDRLLELVDQCDARVVEVRGTRRQRLSMLENLWSGGL